MKSLALNSCNLNGELLAELKNSIASHTALKELYLFANKIETEGSVYISAIIKNKEQLQCLGLSNNKLGSGGAEEIANKGLRGKRFMTKISIENNVIGNNGLCAISQALMEGNQMSELYLYNNEIDDFDEPDNEFCAFLAQHKELTMLGLEFNRIGYKGLIMILESMHNHDKLEKLYLNQNDITGQAGDAIFEFVSKIKNLKELRLSNN